MSFTCTPDCCSSLCWLTHSVNSFLSLTFFAVGHKLLHATLAGCNQKVPTNKVVTILFMPFIVAIFVLMHLHAAPLLALAIYRMVIICWSMPCWSVSSSKVSAALFLFLCCCCVRALSRCTSTPWFLCAFWVKNEEISKNLDIASETKMGQSAASWD